MQYLSKFFLQTLDRLLAIQTGALEIFMGLITLTYAWLFFHISHQTAERVSVYHKMNELIPIHLWAVFLAVLGGTKIISNILGFYRGRKYAAVAGIFFWSYILYVLFVTIHPWGSTHFLYSLFIFSNMFAYLSVNNEMRLKQQGMKLRTLIITDELDQALNQQSQPKENKERQQTHASNSYTKQPL